MHASQPFLLNEIFQRLLLIGFACQVCLSVDIVHEGRCSRNVPTSHSSSGPPPNDTFVSHLFFLVSHLFFLCFRLLGAPASRVSRGTSTACVSAGVGAVHSCASHVRVRRTLACSSRVFCLWRTYTRLTSPAQLQTATTATTTSTTIDPAADGRQSRQERNKGIHHASPPPPHTRAGRIIHHRHSEPATTDIITRLWATSKFSVKQWKRVSLLAPAATPQLRKDLSPWLTVRAERPTFFVVLPFFV